MRNNPFLSIVLPVFNEEAQIEATVRAIEGVLASNSLEHELIIVDDGSRDHTWDAIAALSSQNRHVHAIRLSRNFGKENALCAGLEAAAGDACIVMDGDLQHPPEHIPEMVRLWREGSDIVECVKTSRTKDRIQSRIAARVFNALIHRLTGFDFGQASDFKLLDAKVVDAWRRMGERNTFFRGMSAWLGFRKSTIGFEVPSRGTGRSKWSMASLWRLAINAIASFSSAPLQLVTFAGVFFFVLSVALGAQTLYMKYLGGAVSGFTTVILLQLFIGSMLMISLGIIGTYIAKIFDEVKHRPRYLVDREIGGDAANKPREGRADQDSRTR
jgi:dolichol-phosphate mannosyltransferase